MKISSHVSLTGPRGEQRQGTVPIYSSGENFSPFIFSWEKKLLHPHSLIEEFPWEIWDRVPVANFNPDATEQGLSYFVC
jgi:hypothetical protein